MAMHTHYNATITNMIPVPMFRFGTIDTTFTDKVRKGVGSVAINLQTIVPGSNTIRISGVSPSRPLRPPPTSAPPASTSMTRCSPATPTPGAGPATPTGSIGLSTDGHQRLDISPVTCTWSFAANNLDGGLNRCIDSHYGLGFKLVL